MILNILVLLNLKHALKKNTHNRSNWMVSERYEGLEKVREYDK